MDRQARTERPGAAGPLSETQPPMQPFIHASTPAAARLRRRIPRSGRPGLGIVEVLVAAAILAVAGLAALELLAQSDATAREARRLALAACEAEDALAKAADEVRHDRPASTRRLLDAGASGESLGGCVLVVTEREERPTIVTGSGATRAIPVVRLMAEVRDSRDQLVARLERLAPAPVEPDP